MRICERIETSSAETGSSHITSLGSTASARAIAMRWRWPPENSCGYRLVADDEFRLDRQRPRNRNALALTAGEFVRVAPRETGLEPDQAQQFIDAGASLR